MDKTLDGLDHANVELKEQLGEILAELKKNKSKIEKPFEMLYLPSKGLFYEGGSPYLLVGYLSYVEENMLSSEMMIESGDAYLYVLERLIMDESFDVSKIITADVQAIALFLRAYAYGDSSDFKVKCTKCGMEDETKIRLSSLQMKEVTITPDENKELPLMVEGVSLKIKVPNFQEEYRFYRGKPGNMDRTAFYIAEINGVRGKAGVLNELRRLRVDIFRKIKSEIDSLLPGVDTKIKHACPSCEHVNEVNIGNPIYFIQLPESYKNSMLEELFILTYYGKNISLEDAKKMTVVERKWFIKRLTEEIEKQRTADREAMSKAKSKRG